MKQQEGVSMNVVWKWVRQYKPLLRRLTTWMFQIMRKSKTKNEEDEYDKRNR